ncbi:lipopolysaccharide biosynthesis protein [Brachybacterium sp. AOP25-B2-12]|uniref:lipopolysaccharide biosynthesis protein n=1 Tax=Brachybacterium sp. AOP25-B2-12 TaxID=3457710 RepID=UPI0040335616
MTGGREAPSPAVPEDTAAPEEPQKDSTARVGTDALAVGLGYLASFAYPLVSLPFLARVFGAADLGRLMFALALLQIVVYVTDFGFGMGAIRRVAVARDRTERSAVALSTIAAKALLWTVCAAVLMVIVAAVPSLRTHWEMYAVGVALIGVGALYPNWFLQGIGRVKSFALLTSCSRLVALALLLLTVHGPQDIVLAMTWQQFPLALSAIASWVMLALVWKDIVRVRVTVAAVRHALVDSWPLFIANIATVVMGTANSVVLGVVTTPVQVAYFGAGERFSNAVRGVMRGVTDAMLPRMSRADDSSAGLQRLIAGGIIGGYAAAGLILALASPWFIPWYLGDEMRDAAPVTQLMGVTLLMVAVSSVLMLRATAQHRFSQVARLATAGAAVHLVLVILGALGWGAIGAAVALIVSEGLQALLFALDARTQRRRTRRTRPQVLADLGISRRRRRRESRPRHAR